jgi:hypothetical protein
VVNNNVYVDSAYKFPFEGDKSIFDDLRSEFEFNDQPNFTWLSFKLSKQIIEAAYPLISSTMVGQMPLPHVFMENPDGTPLNITIDYFGNETDQKKVMPGPFQKISAGANKFSVWPPTGR